MAEGGVARGSRGEAGDVDGRAAALLLASACEEVLAEGPMFDAPERAAGAAGDKRTRAKEEKARAERARQRLMQAVRACDVGEAKAAWDAMLGGDLLGRPPFSVWVSSGGEARQDRHDAMLGWISDMGFGMSRWGGGAGAGAATKDSTVAGRMDGKALGRLRQEWVSQWCLMDAPRRSSQALGRMAAQWAGLDVAMGGIDAAKAVSAAMDMVMDGSGDANWDVLAGLGVGCGAWPGPGAIKKMALEIVEGASGGGGEYWRSMGDFLGALPWRLPSDVAAAVVAAAISVDDVGLMGAAAKAAESFDWLLPEEVGKAWLDRDWRSDQEGWAREAGMDGRALPALAFALMCNERAVVEGRRVEGRECFRALSKVPQAAMAACAHPFPAAFERCTLGELEEIHARWPGMLDDGSTHAVRWAAEAAARTEGAWKEAPRGTSMAVFKALGRSELARYLQTSGPGGKSAAEALREALDGRRVAEWDEAFAKWEAKQMKGRAGGLARAKPRAAPKSGRL